MAEQIVIAGFPITDRMGLRNGGQHDGVSYEIVNHNRTKIDPYGLGMEPGPGTWCYYVTVTEAMLSPELFAEFWLDPSHSEPHRSGFPRVMYDYYAAKFAQADWHGGVTFYEKLGGIDGEMRYVKIGCDFAHLWDEGRTFSYAEVESECMETINQLREMYAFKRRCPYFGSYHDESEMIERNGRLYSPAGIAALTKEAVQ